MCIRDRKTADPYRVPGLHVLERLVGEHVNDLVGRRRRNGNAGAEVGHEQKLAHFALDAFEGNGKTGDADGCAVERRRTEFHRR